MRCDLFLFEEIASPVKLFLIATLKNIPCNSINQDAFRAVKTVVFFSVRKMLSEGIQMLFRLLRSQRNSVLCFNNVKKYFIFLNFIIEFSSHRCAYNEIRARVSFMYEKLCLAMFSQPGS